jgi:hypothetical protein
MRAPDVVPLDPLGNGSASFGEAAEVVQPEALLFKTTKEALDEPVLLRGVGSAEVLTEPAIAAGSAKAPALEDESIVTTCRDHTDRFNVGEAFAPGSVKGPLAGLVGENRP